MTYLCVDSVQMSFTHGGTALRVLSDLTFSANIGEVVVIRGPNGCGKTTLLNLIAGLDQPRAGFVRRERDDGATGYVFQNFTSSLLPWLSLRENLLLPLRLGRLPRQTARTALETLSQQYPLETVPLDHLPTQSSGGQKQRVCIARAVLTQSPLLLMDEPLSALDDAGRDDFFQLLASLRRDRLVILVLHDLDDALLAADRLLVLGGKPASVHHDVPAGLPWPRAQALKTTARFIELRSAVLQRVHENAA